MDFKTDTTFNVYDRLRFTGLSTGYRVRFKEENETFIIHPDDLIAEIKDHLLLPDNPTLSQLGKAELAKTTAVKDTAYDHQTAELEGIGLEYIIRYTHAHKIPIYPATNLTAEETISWFLSCISSSMGLSCWRACLPRDIEILKQINKDDVSIEEPDKILKVHGNALAFLTIFAKGDAEFIGEFVKRRMRAYLNSMGSGIEPPENLVWTAGVKHVKNFFQAYPEVIPSIARWALEYEVGGQPPDTTNDTPAAFHMKTQLRMIYKWTGMTAFKTAYDMATTHESAALAISAVAEEAMSAIKVMDDLIEKEGELAPYHILIKGQDPTFVAAAYPRLMYIARKESTTLGQYKGVKKESVPNSSLIDAKMQVNLNTQPTGKGEGPLTTILRRRGVEPKPEDTTMRDILALFSNITNRQ